MTTKPRLFFRADGNSRIGLGHVVRSLALASMLQEDFDCTFAIQNPSVPLAAQIKETCPAVMALPETDNYQAEAEKLATEMLRPDDFLVLDGYHFDPAYQQSLKSSGCKLVCIDDLHEGHFVADLVINHAPGISADQYSAESYTKFCLGPEYVLLREPFLEAARTPIAENPITSAFVCFGGADPTNLTLANLKALEQIPELSEIHLVIGNSYPFRESLEAEKMTTTGKQIHIHQNLDAAGMVHVMRQCQVAVCPASSVLMEALSCGLKAITGYYVENQRHFATWCQAHRYALSLGDFSNLDQAELDRILKEFIRNFATVRPRKFLVTDPQQNLRQAFHRLQQEG